MYNLSFYTRYQDVTISKKITHFKGEEKVADQECQAHICIIVINLPINRVKIFGGNKVNSTAALRTNEGPHSYKRLTGMTV